MRIPVMQIHADMLSDIRICAYICQMISLRICAMCIVYSDLNDERTTTHMHLSRIFGHLHKAYTVCSSSMRFHAGLYALINAH